MKVSIIDWIVRKLKRCIGIVEDGDTASTAISKGKYVVWKGNLYTADSAISAGTTLSASGGSKNLTAVSDGAANSLKAVTDSLNSKGTYENLGTNISAGGTVSFDGSKYRYLLILYYTGLYYRSSCLIPNSIVTASLKCGYDNLLNTDRAYWLKESFSNNTITYVCSCPANSYFSLYGIV